MTEEIDKKEKKLKVRSKTNRVIRFDDDVKDKIRELAATGIPNGEIAEHIGVTRRMLQYRCRKELLEGREIAIANGVKLPPGTGIRGPTPIELSEEDQERVVKMAKIGLRIKDIADIIGMGENTLKYRFIELIEKGRALGHNDVAESAFEMAKDKLHPTVTTFYLTHKCGWESTAQSVKFPDGDGKPQPIGNNTLILNANKIQSIVEKLNEQV